MVPPTARPKRMARSTAPLLSTGSTPGSARSTAEACVLGGAPNAVDAPEKIFDAVDSCACVSSPMTTSHFMCAIPGSCAHGRGFAQMPLARLLVAMRDVQHLRFLEVVGDEMQSDRQSLGIEPAWDAHRGQSGEIRRDREDVVE